MGKTPRERVLITLMPAILAFCGYLLFFDRTKELTAATEALESARSAQVSDDTVVIERVKLSAMREQSDRAKSEKTKLEERRKELAAIRQMAPTVRAEALRQLSKMLWKRGLHPFEESAVEGSEAQTAPSFDEVIRGLGAATTPTTPTRGGESSPSPAEDSTANSRRLWQIRFYGRYGDVAAALELLRDSELPIIPVSLTMSEANNETAWRSWTLLLWL